MRSAVELHFPTRLNNPRVTGDTMLQIITGKFFQTEQVFTTLHRGTLYTNYQAIGQDGCSRDKDWARYPFDIPFGSWNDYI